MLFKTATAYADFRNVSKAAVCMALSGKRNTCKNFRIKYLSDDEMANVGNDAWIYGGDEQKRERYHKQYYVYDATCNMTFINKSEAANCLGVSRMAVSKCLKNGEGMCKGHHLLIKVLT